MHVNTALASTAVYQTYGISSPLHNIGERGTVIYPSRLASRRGCNVGYSSADENDYRRQMTFILTGINYKTCTSNSPDPRIMIEADFTNINI